MGQHFRLSSSAQAAMTETKVKMILFFAIITISIHRSFSCSSFEIPWKRLWTKDCPYTTTPVENSKERVSSLSQLQKGDHIALPRSAYWHHALVEDVDTEKGEINVIEYSNTVKGFSQDNSSPPKNPGKAKVKRGKHKLENEVVYLIKHRESVDAYTAISRARSRLDERKYDVFSNNCEHFVLWCKTGISSSEQINKLVEDGKQGITKGIGLAVGLATKTAPKTGEKIVMTGVRETTKVTFSQMISTGGETILTTGIGEAAKQVVTKTASKGGQEIMKSCVSMATKQVVAQTVSKSGQEIVKNGVSMATKEVVAQTASKGGQEIVKTGVSVATKQVVAQTVSKGGQEIVKNGVSMATKQVVAQTASKGGQEVMKTGVSVTTKQLAAQSVTKGGQEIMKTGTRVTTKQVFTHTASKAGKEIVTEGTRVTTREVVTRTSTETGAEAGESLIGGAVFVVAIEGALALYDINRAHEDMEAGKMNEQDFQKTAMKRVVSGIGNVAGSTAGATIGQVLIPVPFLGSIVGGVVGGFAGRYFGDTAGNVAFGELNKEGEN